MTIRTYKMVKCPNCKNKWACPEGRKSHHCHECMGGGENAYLWNQHELTPGQLAAIQMMKEDLYRELFAWFEKRYPLMYRLDMSERVMRIINLDHVKQQYERIKDAVPNKNAAISMLRREYPHLLRRTLLKLMG